MFQRRKILKVFIAITPLFVAAITLFFSRIKPLEDIALIATGLAAVFFAVGVYYNLDKLGILNIEKQELLNTVQRQRKLSEEYSGIIADISTCSSWKLAAYRTVNLLVLPLSHKHGYVVANILSFRASELYFEASSLPAGQELATQHYHFPANTGITGWVARTGKECLLRDVHADPEKRYLAHPVFQNIKSEVSAPIRYGDNKIVGVIDLQSATPFDEDDLVMLQTLGVQLGEIYRRLEFLEVQRKLAELSISLAKRVITIHDLGMLLNEIGQVARDVLEADIISYYYVNPSDNNLIGPFVAGKLLQPDLQIKPDEIPFDDFLNRTLEYKTIQFFSTLPDYLAHFEPGGQARLPFVIREQVQSYVAIPLRTDSGIVGLMFVNYRACQIFSNEFKDLIEIFSSLSSLAIQNCQHEEITAMVRHAQLIRDLHDTVQHRLLGAEKALTYLLHSDPNSDSWKDNSMASMNYLGSARKIIYNMQQGVDIFTLKTILEHIRWHANLIRGIYKINVELNLPELDDKPIITWLGNQIEFVLEEVIYNAVHHSKTENLQIDVELRQSDLYIRVHDFGVGFDVNTVQHGFGLDNIRQRVESYLNGSLQIQSQLGQGTDVAIQFPVLIDF